jgi:hypothetical protein
MKKIAVRKTENVIGQLYLTPDPEYPAAAACMTTCMYSVDLEYSFAFIVNPHFTYYILHRNKKYATFNDFTQLTEAQVH